MARNFAGAASDKVATTLASNSNLRSYSIWTYRATDGGGSLGRIFHKGTSGSTVNFNNNSAGSYDFSRTWSGGNGLWSIDRPTADAWHHILIVYDSTATTGDPIIYLDGSSVTVTENSGPSGTRTDNAEVYNVGNRGDNNNRNWGGDLAEFAVWDRLLTAADAAALARGLSPLALSPNLIEYAPLVRENVSRKLSPPTVTGTAVVPHPLILGFGGVAQFPELSSADVTLALSGVLATADLGSLQSDNQRDLSGVQASGVVGSVIASITLALSGISANTSVGDVTETGGNTSIGICLANVQHGEGTDGTTNYARQIAHMVASKDIVCMQERSTGETGWNAGMSAAGFTEEVYRENGHGTDGPSIWVKSTVTVNDNFDHALSTGAIGWDGTTNVDKAAVGVHVTVGGISFYIFNTHLAWSAGADSEGSTFSAIRVAQINELMSWISGIVGSDPNVLIVGDMNFGPDYPKSPSGLQIDLILDAGYSDLWVQGIAESKATAPWDDRDSVGGADMPIGSLTTRTHDTRRIDYFFLHENAQMILTAIDLPDLRANCSGALTGSPLFCPDTASDQRWGVPDDYGVRPSDHNFMDLALALSPDVTVDISGVSATVSVGSLGVSRQTEVVNVVATVSGGVLSPSVATDLSGDVSVTDLSSLSVANTVFAFGVESTGAVQALTAIWDGSADLSGVQANSAAGTLVSDLNLAVGGNESATHVSSVGVSTSLPVTGIESDSEAGTVGTESDTGITISLSGVSANAVAESLTSTLSTPLTGLEIVGQVDNLIPDVAPALIGNQISANVESLVVSSFLDLGGTDSLSNIGNLTSGISIGMSGSGVTSSLGTLTVISGADLASQPSAIISVVEKPTAVLSLALDKPSATITKWP